MSLNVPNSMSATELVDKHQPMVLKKFITEHVLADDDWKGQDSIRVICRFRPPNKRELAFSLKKNVPDVPPEWDNDQVIRLERAKNEKSQSKSSNKPFRCTLDHILRPSTAQKQVFYLVGQPMILSCLEGFNSTIFAYGQSGSGKTYTMFGPENDQSNVEQFGLIPRCFIYLFQKLNKQLSNNGGNLQEFKVKMELLQIYKRDLLDLLNPKSKAKLVIKTDFRNDSIFVQNLRSVEVHTVEEAFACLTEAQSNRIVAGHALNSVSSRSHMLVIVNIMQRAIDGSVKRSKLNFGDLAGSEDLTKALGKNPDPVRRQEAIAINSSLSALTTAMSFLSKGKKPGYRDSPLTHILKDSLGGNSKTIMFVACSPHIYNRNETIRALRFAQTAKKVKNKAKKNEEQSAAALKARIKELELQVASLQAQLVEARGKKNVFKNAISKMAIVDDGLGNRAFSLRIPASLPNKSAASSSNKKPGPVPFPRERGYSQNSPVLPENAELPGSNLFADLFKEEEDELAVDELLKEDGGEEKLNYIQEISELRRQLDDSLQSNLVLNGQIAAKNVELEQCSIQIAQLLDDVEQAQSAAASHNVSAAGGAIESNVDKNEVPSSSDEEDLSEVPSQIGLNESSQRTDSCFSLSADGNDTMLNYLMELQRNIQNATEDFQELKQSVDVYDYYDDEESASSEDAEAIEARKKKIDDALTEKLSNNRGTSFMGCFSCNDAHEQDETTSLLVEEYLKHHVRAEMKKLNRKKRKKRRTGNQEKYKKEESYNFDNEEFSVLTPSPMSAEHAPFSFRSDTTPLLLIEEGSDEETTRFHDDNLDDSMRDIASMKKTKPNQRKVRV